MSRTISGTFSSPVLLTNTANNPVTITGAARLTATSSAYALYGEGGANQGWTITNAGVVSAGSNGNGIQLGSGGVYVGASVITNQTGGTISGVYGIRIYNTAASSVVNQSGATIASATDRAVYFAATGTLTNSGVVSAPTADTQQIGVLMESGGVIVNNAGATIGGGNGVILIGSGTVTNAGTIRGGSSGGFAVDFGAAGANRLIVDPGAVFSGAVVGGNGTLELASASSTGALTATNFSGFTGITFDAGAQWTLAGSASALAGTVQGFTHHDTIDLLGFVATSETYTSGAMVLTNASNAHTTLHFSGGGLTTNAFLIPGDGGTGTDISIACFAAGSMIATPSGTVAVEALAAGDLVLSVFGGVVPVVWVGHRSVDRRRHPRPLDVLPVRVRAGAFGPGRPVRDLVLSPDHSVYVQGVLVPIRHLVNGATIVRETVDRVTYHHVELPAHDVILAEAMPAESFLDTGNRGAFANAEGATVLHPDFARQVWRSEACAQLVTDGPRLAAIRAEVAAHAEASGFALTADAAVCLLVDGQAVPAVQDGNCYRFALPEGARTGRLVSRSCRPARLGWNTPDDRELGVAVVALEHDGEAMPLDAPTLREGWLPPEPGLRWTNGNAAVALAGAGELAVTIGLTGLYWHRAA